MGFNSFNELDCLKSFLVLILKEEEKKKKHTWKAIYNLYNSRLTSFTTLWMALYCTVASQHMTMSMMKLKV